MRAFRNALSFVVVLGVAACGGLPEDDDLLERFRQHRGELETLVRMFKADTGLGRVGEGFTRPDNPQRVGVSPDRVREYRRLCQSAGAPGCIEGYDATFDRLYEAADAGRGEGKDLIWIHVAARGLSISGTSKGFLYSASPPFDVVANLNRISPRASGTWVRHIEGPWYLYFNYED